MFPTQKINELATRKQQLLAVSRINRQLLELEAEHLRGAVAWVDRGYRVAQSIRPIFKYALPIAGLFLVRQRRGVKSWLANALAGWQLARKAMGIWHTLRAAAK